MWCAVCSVPLLEFSYYRVCPQCGVQQTLLDNSTPGYLQKHAILNHRTTYSRKYRFKNLLLKTVGYSTGPHRRDVIWEYLEARKDQLTDYKSIQKVLSRRKTKNKKYDLLPILCRMYAGLGDQNKMPHDVIQKALRIFANVEARWNMRDEHRFFSYYFICETILDHLGYGHCMQFQKKLLCLKRRQYYTDLLKDLGGIRPQECAMGSLRSAVQVPPPSVPILQEYSPPSGYIQNSRGEQSLHDVYQEQPFSVHGPSNKCLVTQHRGGPSRAVFSRPERMPLVDRVYALFQLGGLQRSRRSVA